VISLLIGVAGSAIVAVFYGWFIAQREDKIRGYLAARREGRARRRAVRAFVEAVRGYAPGEDTAILAVLILLIPLTLGFASIIRGTYLLEQLVQNDAPVPAMLRVIRDLRPTNSIALILVIYLFGIACLGVYLYGGLVWLQFVWIRRMFAHRIERFMLRIQGLASEAELADLASLEDRVFDESSLREFVTAAKAIAAKHDLGQLVDRFDLWAKGRPEVQPEGSTPGQLGT
jgi:hypothetical protein